MKCLKPGLLILFFTINFFVKVKADNSGSIDYSSIIAEKKKIEDDYKLRVQNILDRILGAEKAIVTNLVVELKLEQLVNIREAAQKKQQDQSRLRKEEKFILPGVPLPKSLLGTSAPEEEKAERSSAVQNKIIIPSLIWKLKVTIIVDDKISDALVKKVEIIVTDAIELNRKRGDELRIEKVPFISPWYNYIFKPSVIIFTFLGLILLFFLFGPFVSLLKNLVNAIREGRGTEVSIQAKTEQGELVGGSAGSSGSGINQNQEELPATGEEKAKNKKHFSFINKDNLKSLLYLIQEESAETISLIVTYLPPDVSGEVIASLPPELQMQVALCIATVKLTSQEDVFGIEEEIRKKIDFLIGGMESFLKILDQVDNRTRKEMLAALERQSPRLAKRAREFIFTFEDIPKLPDQTVQIILREIKMDQLAIALRASNIEPVKEKILNNMSEGGKAMLKEEMEYGRPVTQEQIEEIQREIEKTIKQMEADRKIVIRMEETRKQGIEIEGKLERLELRLINQTNEPSSNQSKQNAFNVSASNAVACYQNGVQLYQAGKINEAITQFQKSIQFDPGVWQTYQYLGSCFWSQGRIDEAIGAYQKVIELNPSNTQLKDWLLVIKQKRKEQLEMKHG